MRALIGLPAMVASAVLAWAAVSTADTSSSRDSTASSAEIAGQQVAAFRRSRAASDALRPDDLDRSPLLADAGSDVVDLSQSRLLNERHRLFAAPTKDGRALCVVGAGILGCRDAVAFAAEGAAPSVYWHADGVVRLASLVSDDVPELEAVFDDGSTQTVGVVAGVAVAVLRGRPAAIRWTGRNGSVHINAPDSSLVEP
ncbi:MAG TPA: hypothetical protein VFZ89_19435 [Solirubrobacteraceae bacterium]